MDLNECGLKRGFTICRLKLGISTLSIVPMVYVLKMTSLKYKRYLHDNQNCPILPRFWILEALQPMASPNPNYDVV